MFCRNPSNEILIKVTFRFSHYKSLETLSCHSIQNTYETAINTNKFVQACDMNISAKFQPCPQYSFWGVDFLSIFRKFGFLVAMPRNQIDG